MVTAGAKCHDFQNMLNVTNVINNCMGIIYKTTNLHNNKIYIGKAKINDPVYLGSGVILKQAIEKYGKENFTKEIIEECDNFIIDQREIFWIDKFNSTDRTIGYNIATGGTGGDTTTNHPEKNNIVKKRTHGLTQWHQSLSESEKALRGKKISDGKKGKSNGHTGLKQTEETKQRIKDSQPDKTDKWRTAHAEAAAKRRGIPLTKKYKPVIVNNIKYSSIIHAIESLGIKHRATFYDRVKRGIIQITYL